VQEKLLRKYTENKMKMKSITQSLILAMCFSLLGSCEDNLITKRQDGLIDGKTAGGGSGHNDTEGYPGGSDGNRYPYPNIIKREYIPSYDLFDYMKCLAWRIEWPSYGGSADIDKIPTVFGRNGSLNSFEYLNNTDPENTYKALFSIYYDDKVVSASNLWDELDHSFYAPAGEMESVHFAAVEQPLENIKDWVTERPQLFEENWTNSADQELEYEEGDFFIFKLAYENLFGGIRIVSMSPRIIEVYLAVPNI
jgi:hypothetical protein